MYKPRPIDTSNVHLSEELLQLTELLADNTHENWAKQRISEGWKFGAERDDGLKEHPCLIPYDQLPESEKDYDRQTSIETLKTIISLGYRVVPPSSTQQNMPQRLGETDEIAQFIEQLKTSTPMSLVNLIGIWQSRNPEWWGGTPEIFQLLAKRMLDLAEPLFAYDILSESLEHWPNDYKLNRLFAHSLIKSGESQRANKILKDLVKEKHWDEETIGLLGRTYKDIWLQSEDDEQKRINLELAHKVYTKSYHLTGGYWTGINVATTAILMGDKTTAFRVAYKVKEQCLGALKDAGDGELYWLKATLGEAELVMNNYSEAEKWYKKAVAHNPSFSAMNSTRSQARLLSNFLTGVPHQFDHCFSISPVVIFAGLMFDKPGYYPPRFPKELEIAVKISIKERLKAMGAKIGYSSAAAGGDILFAEALLENNGELHIVLPYDASIFKRDKVDIIPGENWGPRFFDILNKAAEILTVSQQSIEGSTASYVYANLFSYGLATMRANQLDTNLMPLSVWDRRRDPKPGGPASVIQHWQKLGHEVEIIDLEKIKESAGTTIKLTEKYIPKLEEDIDFSRGATVEEITTEIVAILFADAVNFSKLSEREIPLFVEHFLGAVAKLLDPTTKITGSPLSQPLRKKTWGDGLYLVFQSVADAGIFALNLSDEMNHTNWLDKGLPSQLNLRIALHAGPVYSCIDPISGQKEYIGSHVNQAARIEPITPPGKVYASQSFAALAAAHGLKEFTFDYVGQVPLAKGYGVFPMYHMRKCNTFKP